MRSPLPYSVGSDASGPRLMQRSNRLRSSQVSGSSGLTALVIAAMRWSAAGVRAGTRPLAGFDHERRLAMRARPDFTDECAGRDAHIAARLVVAPLAVGIFLIGEQSAVAEFRRALQRHAARIVGRPGALQIGMAPWRARRGVGLLRRRATHRLRRADRGGDEAAVFIDAAVIMRHLDRERAYRRESSFCFARQAAC